MSDNEEINLLKLKLSNLESLITSKVDSAPGKGQCECSQKVIELNKKIEVLEGIIKNLSVSQKPEQHPVDHPISQIEKPIEVKEQKEPKENKSDEPQNQPLAQVAEEIQPSLSLLPKGKWDQVRVSLTLPSNKEFYGKIAYWTICSSVAAKSSKSKARDRVAENVDDDSGMKAALFGAADDANNMHNYLMEKGQEYTNQGKFEFSAESVSSLSKAAFFLALENYFNSPVNEASVIFYSGHGFEEAKILMETSQGSYYVEYTEIMAVWRKRAFPNKNKHLLLLMDCCYSGSWVEYLLKYGDFLDVSIQASSTSKQKSNDLGKGKGSLFTGAFLQANNAKVYEINYLDKGVIPKLQKQQPVAFGFKDICKQNFNFGNIITNSWQEMFMDNKTYVFHTDDKALKGAVTVISKPTDKVEKDKIAHLYSKFEHIVMVFKEGSISLQAEVFNSQNDVKYNLHFTLKTYLVTKNTYGHLSLYQPSKISESSTQDSIGNFTGRYFNTSLKKKTIFEVQPEQITLAVKFVIDLCLELTTKKDAKPNEETISRVLQLYKDMTVMYKTFIIIEEAGNFGAEEDDEGDVDNEEFDELQKSTSMVLEELTVTHIDENSESDLVKYLSSTSNQISKLNISNSKDYPLLKTLFSIGDFKRINSLQLQLGFFNNLIIRHIENFINSVLLTSFELSFKEKSETATTESPLEKLFFNRTLQKVKFVNLPDRWANHIIQALLVEKLESFHIEHVTLNGECIDKMSEYLTKHRKLKTLKAIDCDLDRTPELAVTLEYIDLTDNDINDSNLEKLLKKLSVLKYKYSIVLNNNLLTSVSVNTLRTFLFKNTQCYFFDVANNSLGLSNYIMYTSILNYNNTLTNLCLSGVKLEVTKEFTTFIKNQKTIRTLEAVKCGMNDSLLGDFIKELMVDSTNLISYLDVSDNLVSKSDVLKVMGINIKNRACLETLIMKNCVRLQPTKANEQVQIENFFLNTNLVSVDFSNWQCLNNPNDKSKSAEFIVKKPNNYNLTQNSSSLVSVNISRTQFKPDFAEFFASLNLVKLEVSHYQLGLFKNNRIKSLIVDKSALLLQLNQAKNNNDEKAKIEKEIEVFKQSYLEIMKNIANGCSALRVDDCDFKQVFSLFDKEFFSKNSNTNECLSLELAEKANASKPIEDLRIENLVLQDVDKKAVKFILDSSYFSCLKSVFLDGEKFTVKHSKKAAEKTEENNQPPVNKLDKLLEKFKEKPGLLNMDEVRAKYSAFANNKYLSYELLMHFIIETLSALMTSHGASLDDWSKPDYCNSYQNIATPFEVIDNHTRILTISSNYFNFNDFTRFVNLKSLEVLELDAIHIKSFLKKLNSLLPKELNLRALIIKGSEFNSDEIQQLKDLFLTFQSTLTELHLVNSYIDGRESNILFDYISKLGKLRTLNLSKNYIDKKFMSNLVAYLRTPASAQLENLILRNCSIEADLMKVLLLSLKGRKLRVLDLSGFKNGKTPATSIQGEFNDYENFCSVTLDYSSAKSMDWKFTNSTYLVCLELHYVDIEKVTNQLYNVFKYMRTLEHLTLSNCYRETTLLKTLSQFHRICLFKSINLQGCLINKKNAFYLREIISHKFIVKDELSEEEMKKNKDSLMKIVNTERIMQLRKLCLRGCQLEDEALSVIIDLIKDSSLLELDLSSNMLTLHSLLALIKEIYENTLSTKIINIGLFKSFSGDLYDFNTNLEIFRYENAFTIGFHSILDKLKDLRLDSIGVTEPKKFDIKNSLFESNLANNESKWAMSYNNFIKDEDTYTKAPEYESHSEKINSVIVLEEKYFITGGNDGKVKVLDMHLGYALNSFEFNKRVGALALLKDKFLGVSLIDSKEEGAIKLIDLNAMECLDTTIKVPPCLISRMIQLKDYTIAFTYDNQFRAYNLESFIKKKLEVKLPLLNKKNRKESTFDDPEQEDDEEKDKENEKEKLDKESKEDAPEKEDDEEEEKEDNEKPEKPEIKSKEAAPEKDNTVEISVSMSEFSKPITRLYNHINMFLFVICNESIEQLLIEDLIYVGPFKRESQNPILDVVFISEKEILTLDAKFNFLFWDIGECKASLKLKGDTTPNCPITAVKLQSKNTFILAKKNTLELCEIKDNIYSPKWSTVTSHASDINHIVLMNSYVFSFGESGLIMKNKIKYDLGGIKDTFNQDEDDDDDLSWDSDDEEEEEEEEDDKKDAKEEEKKYFSIHKRDFGAVTAIIKFDDDTIVVSYANNGDGENIVSWNLKTNEEILAYHGHSASVNALILVEYKKHFVSGCEEGFIRLWGKEQKESIVKIDTDSGVCCFVSCTYEQGRNLFLAGCIDGTFKILEFFPEEQKLTQLCEVDICNEDSRGIMDAKFLYKHIIAILNTTHDLEVWEINDKLDDEEGYNYSFDVFDYDNENLCKKDNEKVNFVDIIKEGVFICGRGKFLHIFSYDPEKNKEDRLTVVKKISFTYKPLFATLIPMQSLLVIGTTCGISYLEPESYQLILHSKESNYCKCFCLTNDDVLLVGDKYSFVHFNSLSQKKCLDEFEEHTSYILTIRMLPRIDKNVLFTCSNDQTIKKYNIKDSKFTGTFLGHGGCVNGVEDINETTICSLSDDNTLVLWDVNSFQEIERHEFERSLKYFIKLKDKEMLVADEAYIVKYDLTKKNVISKVPINSEIIFMLKHDEKRVIACCNDQKLLVLSVVDLTLISVLKAHIGEVRSCDSLNSDQIVSCSADNQIIVWSLSREAPIHVFKHKLNLYTIIKFTDEIIITAGSNLALWNLNTKKCDLQRGLDVDDEKEGTYDHEITALEKIKNNTFVFNIDEDITVFPYSYS